MRTHAFRHYTVAFCILLCLAAAPASALPKLQLYSPGAEYVDESWLTYDNPYTLMVVGWDNRASVITDLNLVISLPEDYNGQTYDAGLVEWVRVRGVPGDTALSTDNNPGNRTGVDVRLLPGDLQFGSPDYPGNGAFPPHDVYPCSFWQIVLPDLQLDSAAEDVYDFTQDFDPDDPGDAEHTGDIQYYEISYVPYDPEVLIHIDAFGLAGGRYWVAPFSHDADAGYTPEPATMGLLLAGLAGLGFVKRRRSS